MANKALVDHFLQMTQRLKTKWSFLEPRTIIDKLIVESGSLERFGRIVSADDPLSPYLEGLCVFGTMTAALNDLLSDNRLAQHRVCGRFVNLLSENCLNFKNQQLWILLCLLVLAKEQRSVSFPYLNRVLLEVYRRRLVTTKVVYSIQIVCMFTRLVDCPERLSDRLAERLTREGAWPTDLPNRLLPYICYALCFCSKGAPLSISTLRMFEAKLAKCHCQMELDEISIVAYFFSLYNYEWPRQRKLLNDLNSRMASCRMAPAPFTEKILYATLLARSNE
ncbi:hypothetical protein M514_08910 [Trichuris suis]|uniref:Uncharacterized protein n=1 Tax=Trichuris suis TaxID=68888 RepID=A0A085LYW9_9BILA|nr:hypothetical protein M513_08910 [Trichuris suis]KFD70435.1 hypothetical protein M514_08910 [Trichuris suis]KHJ47940.1 hypothetical protein D918_02099 [Trichuris suis]